MDYEKKYKEAIARLKQWDREHPNGYSVQERDEFIFPELKESEDEKIRKKIIKLVKEHSVNHERCQMEAWLGKQGEHANFRNKIQIGDNVTRNQDGVLVNLSQLKRIAKPAEEYNITGIGSKNAQGKLGEMIKKLKPVNEVLEQKPAEWTHKDGKNLAELWEILSVHRNTNPQVDNLMEWVKDLVSYKRQGWSEEDENMLDIIITDINFAQKFYHTSKLTSYDKKINWLKSLRPQSHWRPSDEQMENLSRAFNGEVYRASLLMELYQDLKKLKE